MSKEQAFDCIVHGGLLVSSSGAARQDVFIRDGKVVRLGRDDGSPEAARRIDASGKYVLPGLVDAHCHPVYADKIDTLSQSAAFGGITTLIPFIGTVKAWGQASDLMDSLRKFIDLGREQSLVDFGLHCTFVRENLKEMKVLIPRAVEMGIISFKAFMAYARRGMKLEDNEILMLMEVIRDNGGLFMVHAENGAIIDYLVEKFQAEGKTSPEYFLPSQPNLVESEAVYRALTMAGLTRTPIYLPHLSAGESLDVVRWFRARGDVKMFTETCLHYLTLTDEEMKKSGTLAKVGPALKGMKDVEACWRAVEEGLIDVVATDAAGRMMKDKEPIRDRVFDSPHGLPDMEALFPVLYDEGINRGHTTLPRLVRMTSEMPARIFGLYPPKGALEPGFDADLMLFDPWAEHVITASTQHKKADYTVYEGRHCLGAPVLTMSRGRVLVEGDKQAARPGDARYLPRNPSLALYRS
ncbi:MAG: amidohydrolase family protein [Deltaproteobacteria bacterium]|nr:amidohydrolase family protein [Deltaproteobacteria bacterium]